MIDNQHVVGEFNLERGTKPVKEIHLILGYFRNDGLEGEYFFDHVEFGEGQELLSRSYHNQQHKNVHMGVQGVVWRYLKPHLEVSFQNSHLKAFPAKDLNGFFHEINFQGFQLCCRRDCQDIDLFQIYHHGAGTRIT